ncbi:hypothetical protein [Pectobacterium versatile]|nr:hypothetical protein [Pectobacterium versatile]
MNIITGAAIGAIVVCIWHVMQLTRRVEKLGAFNKAKYRFTTISQ